MDGREIQLLKFINVRGPRGGTLVDGGFLGQGGDGHPDNLGAIKVGAKLVIFGDLTDDNGIQVPLIEDPLDFVLGTFRGNQ